MWNNLFRISCSVFIFVLVSSSFIIGQSLDKVRSDSRYKVVINHEEQYSIWLTDKSLPRGWKETKIVGDLSKCQNYIKEVWTDMRPLSVRKLKLPGNTIYMVVINHEEQYSILPIETGLPRGWKELGIKGDLDKCSNYIKEVWTDMRPLSLRNE